MFVLIMTLEFHPHTGTYQFYLLLFPLLEIELFERRELKFSAPMFQEMVEQFDSDGKIRVLKPRVVKSYENV